MINTLLLLTAVTAIAPQADTLTLLEDLKCQIEYTDDSVITEGVSCEYYEAVLGEETAYYVHVVVDLPLGYEIYDDAETEGIDGITINGKNIPDSYITSDLDYTKLLTITVKTVYEKGVAGMLASINDGTYDWSPLLTNPLTLIQGGYYILSAAALVLGGLGLFKSAKTRAKTAKEWERAANETIDNIVKEMKSSISKTISDRFTSELIPILEQCLSNDQNIIKAIALQTSKSKDAPTAILELLMKLSTDVDATKVINEAKRSISEAELAKQKAAEETKKALAEITKVNVKEDNSLEGRY